MDLHTEFRNELHNLEGQECWGVSAGAGSGSRFSLQMGKRILRAKPLKNPTLPEDIQKYNGEFVLFIQNCAWRLDSERMICSSKSPNNNDGPMVQGLRSLTGQRVVTVATSPPGHDLLIRFSGGGALHVLCDCFNEDEDGDNYSLHCPTRVFTIQAKGIVASEARHAT